MKAFLLPHLLAESAHRFPECTAVVDARRSLTYAQLDRAANQVGNVLRQAGVARGDRVGLYLNKSVEAITGIYGILKAGAAYVPMDPSAPPSRLAYITRNCDIRHVLSGMEKAAAWPELLGAGSPVRTLVVVNGREADLTAPRADVRCLAQDALDQASDLAPPLSMIDQDLAYILYTSGSTGQPKGVMISHLNALSFVRWCHKYFEPTEHDVFSNHAPLHFDLTILDIYVAAMAGAALVVVPPEASVFPVQLAGFIERHGITIWYSVPSILTMLVLHGNLTPGRLPRLRHMIFAGEVFPTKHLRSLMTLLPHARFTNLYGPTETNVCTYYRVPPLPGDQTEPIPIGRAIDNVEVFAVGESGERVPPGEVGELHVRGTTVAYGYWGDPEKTARGFLRNSFGPAQDRVYRTGDLVREDGDGDYLFLGRKDHQIKSRGYRIEIGDIEAAIYAHPDVVECAVIPIPDEVVGNRIKAVVVGRRQGLSETDLATFLATLLPKYMIPEGFEFVPALPKTSTGKIDRLVLASPAAGSPRA
jgi:amino acid adenylation domain-containing protein